MRFTKAFYDLLIINPEGIPDERVKELGLECGLTRTQTKQYIRKMEAFNIISFEKAVKKRDKDKWKLKKPKKFLAGR